MAKQSGRPTAAMTRVGSAPIVEDEMDGGLEIPHRSSLTAQTITTRVITAQRVPVPREIPVILQRVQREAEMTGNDFEYRWTVNNRDGSVGVIEGVSIDGAMILLRNYGNCSADVDVVEETPTHWLFRATFVDFETGFNDARLFRQRKSERHGRFDDERALDIALQIGQSKAKRNVVVKAMPVWLVREAVKAAREGAEAAIKDLPKEIEGAVGGYRRAGVTLAMLEAKVGQLASPPGPPVPQAVWVKRDLLNLRQLWNALRDRQTTKEIEFPELAPPPAPAATAAPAAPALADAAPAAPPSKPADTSAETPAADGGKPTMAPEGK